MADKDVNKNPPGNDPAENSLAVKRSGKQTAKLQQRIKVTKWILFCLLLLVIILYLLFIFFWRGGLDGEGGGDEPDYGDFTVQIDEGNRNLISLSEDIEFEGATIRLQGSSVDDLWHCKRLWIPSNIQDLSDGGAHHATHDIKDYGKDVYLIEGAEYDEEPLELPSYFAYTFFLKNCSDEEIQYTYDFVLVDRLIKSELDALEAVRVMIIRNGEETIWANPSLDGTPIEADTLLFNEEPRIITTLDNRIGAGAIDKYTIVMWVDGDDPECVNDIWGNQLKFEMNFEVQNKLKDSVDDTTSETSDQ
ncbi:MAG: hypothetical protein IJB57_05470 [Clostridia bacterium]|nr:hypothetical protein [Clostridia bacterium]